MEFRELQTFLRVAALGSFSGAAREMGYSQAAVTIQIQHMEEELGTRLFDRIGKQTVLTHNGTIFYGYAATIMKELASAKDAVAADRELNGTLAVGAIESICEAVFPSLISEYHKRYPKVTVTVTLDTPDRLLNLMAKNTVDLVYVLDQRIHDPRWTKVLEQPEEIIFVASSAHPITENDSPSLNDVLEWPFVLTEKDASYRLALDRYLAFAGKSLQPFLEIGNTDFIVNYIKSGEGISLLPRYAVESGIREGSLAAIAVEDFHMRAWRQILYHKDKWVTREMDAFLKLVQEGG